MFTYICIPYQLQFVPLSKPACWYFSEILLSLNLSYAEQRRASVPRAEVELTEAACLSQQLGGCPLINSQLDAEGWSLGSPTRVSQLQKQGKGCGHPCFIAYVNTWCKLQLQQSHLLCAVRKGMVAGPSTSVSCSILGIYSAATRGLSRQKFVV